MSSAGYWIALAIFLVGCGAAMVWFIVAIVGVVDAPNDFARTEVPSSMRVYLEKGEWVIYHESPGIDSFGRFGSQPVVEVTDPSGFPVIINYHNVTTTYSTGDHDGSSIGSFDAHQSGIYGVDVAGEPGVGEYVAIGRPLFDGAIGGIVGSIGLGTACFLVAVVLLIVTIVRRGRSKRAIAAAPYRAAPPAPGAPGSFAAPIPTGAQAPRPPATPGPPPAPGTYTGPPVAPPPGSAPAPGAPYTPGWAAPTGTSGPVPPPPSSPAGFVAPGNESPAPPANPSPWSPAPPEPASSPGSPDSDGPDADAGDDPAGNDTWDKPGAF